MILPLGGDFFANNQLKARGAERTDRQTFLRILISPPLIKNTPAKISKQVPFYLSLMVENLSDFKASIGVQWLN